MNRNVLDLVQLVCLIPLCSPSQETSVNMMDLTYIPSVIRLSETGWTKEGWSVLLDT